MQTREYRPQTKQKYDYDIVVGPVAAKWADRMLFAEADQISFHTERASNILTQAEVLSVEI